MRRFRRAGLAAAMTAVALTVGTITGSPAYADYNYTLKFQTRGWFLADYCLHAESYDERNRDHRMTCTGGRGVGDFSITVPTREGYRVWLDVWVSAGKNGLQITMHNGYLERVGQHVYNTTECRIPFDGTTQFWWLDCKRDGTDWQEYWNSNG